MVSVVRFTRDLADQVFVSSAKRRGKWIRIAARDFRFAFIATRLATRRLSVRNSLRDQTRPLLLLPCVSLMVGQGRSRL